MHRSSSTCLFKGSWRLSRFPRAVRERLTTAMALLGLLLAAALLAGCGGGGGTTGNAPSPGVSVSGPGISSAIVSGVAATGAPLAGQVTLRDASAPPRNKATVVAGDGSFAIDVTDMTAPFLLKASGTIDGKVRTLYSFAAGPGTANINPLSTVAVASAAGVSDPSTVFDHPDAATVNRIKAAMPTATATLQSKLQPLLAAFSADNTNPVSDPFRANHTGLDGLFDNVSVSISNGVVTITDVTTGTVIFTGRSDDIEHGNLNENDDHVFNPSARPAAPANVTVVGGNGQLTITWDPVANATSYDLFYRKLSGSNTADAVRAANANHDDGNFDQLVRNVSSPYVLTGLDANTTYLVRLRALNNNRSGPFSAPMTTATTSTMAPTPAAPAAPSGVTATGGTQQVTISWPAVTGATSYNLYWSTTTGVTTASGTKIGGVSSPAVQTGLTDATTYFYVVTAVNSAGESAASAQVAATTLPAGSPPPAVPSAPTGLNATGGDNQVTLTWPAVSGATSYNVYRSTTTGVTTANGTKVAGVSSPFADTGLAASTTYFYIVTAVNGTGESSASAQASATTNAPAATAPAAPTGLMATGGTKQVTLSWNLVAGATSYNLYWATASGVTIATGTKVAGVTSPFIQTGLVDSTAYFFIVTAVNGTGESIASAEATATTAAAGIDGAALYTQYCSGCHGSLATSEKRGATSARIIAGIANNGSMNLRFNATTGTLIKLTPAQIDAIAAALQ
jgi:mono/diheme cytochrome c family protein